jgi:hypothetical protein
LVLGLAPNTPLPAYAIQDALRWLHFISFWLVMATASGTLYGLLGHWWKRSAPPAVAAAVGLPFVAEPGLWTLKVREFRGPLSVWTVEVIVGLAISVSLTLRSTSLRRTRGSQPAQ